MQTSITPKFSLVFHTNKLGLFTYAHLFYRETHKIYTLGQLSNLPGKPKTRNPKIQNSPRHPLSLPHTSIRFEC